MPFVIDGLDHLVVAVSNVEASAAWYQRVLGMTREDAQPRGPGTPVRTSMHFGQQKLNLRPAATTQDHWFTSASVHAGSDDLCFLTAAPLSDVVAHIEACGVAVEVGPGKRRGARGTITSVYCRDPDGSLIEIATYGEA